MYYGGECGRFSADSCTDPYKKGVGCVCKTHYVIFLLTLSSIYAPVTTRSIHLSATLCDALDFFKKFGIFINDSLKSHTSVCYCQL